jgi:sugar (pentulose or hexulose) kinase
MNISNIGHVSKYIVWLLSGTRHVEYERISNSSAYIAVAIFRVSVH